MLQKGWNISLPFEQAIDSLLIAGKWRSQTFRSEFSEFIPSDRGVYFLILRGEVNSVGPTFSTLSTPVYVGMSMDLKRRFKTHVSGNKSDQLWRKLQIFQNQVTYYYLTLPELNKDKLCELEQNLIDMYGPSLNQINAVVRGQTLTGQILKE